MFFSTWIKPHGDNQVLAALPEIQCLFFLPPLHLGQVFEEAVLDGDYAVALKLLLPPANARNWNSSPQREVFSPHWVSNGFDGTHIAGMQVTPVFRGNDVPFVEEDHGAEPSHFSREWRKSLGKCCHVAFHGRANLAEDCEGQVPFTALDATDIGAIYPRVIRKIFLRPIEAFSLLSDSLAERL